jgi:hypothetical protein
VTFYIPNGSVEISGNAEVHLFAPSGSDVAPAMANTLFYLPASNTSTVDIQGNTDSEFFGTIYAPGGTISLTGTNDTTPTFSTQLIGYKVYISGNVDMEINFNQNNALKKPTSIDLSR